MILIVLPTKEQLSLPTPFPLCLVGMGYNISCQLVLLIESHVSHSAKSGSLMTSLEP